MTQKDIDQLRHVLTTIVEDGHVWASLRKETQEAAMAQFLRLENEALAVADAAN